jgi:hypothetical protein
MDMKRTPLAPDKLMLLLGGVALGGLLMALFTPKAGREVRGTLRMVKNRLLGIAEAPEDERVEALFI